MLHSCAWWNNVPMRRLCAAGRYAVDTLDGWIWSTDGGDWHDGHCLSLLDGNELERMSRLPDRHRRSFLRNHAAMRVLLAEQLAVAPDRLRLSRDERGKPCLVDDATLHFNLSHSASFGALGVSPDPVGVDIERPDGAAYDELAKRLFPYEAAQLVDVSGMCNDPLAFARLWTAKESYLKALGRGLRQRLDSFRLQVDLQGRALELVGAGTTANLPVCRFHVFDQPLNSNYVGTFTTLHDNS
jgi:4'-phosphopantetheinyl transferase